MFIAGWLSHHGAASRQSALPKLATWADQALAWASTAADVNQSSNLQREAAAPGPPQSSNVAPAPPPPDSRPAAGSASSQLQPKPDLVEQFQSQLNMSRRQRVQQARWELVQRFQRHASDTASPEVTVAVWTHMIREEVKGLYSNTKNHAALRHVELLMHKRRRLLEHLRDTRFDAYAACLHRLGLADVFGTLTSADRYPVGKAHDDPAGGVDTVQRLRFAFHRGFKQKKTSQFKRLLPQLQAQDPALPPPPATLVAGAVQRLKPAPDAPGATVAAGR